MNDQEPSEVPRLSPTAEGAVGALVGGVLGGGLMLAGFISPPAIIGVAAGVGLGSWFNAWRRQRRNADDGSA